MGMFVAQDGVNSGGKLNYKFVTWEDIALSFAPPLSIDTLWNPRPACSDGQDNDFDGDWVCDDMDICLGVFKPGSDRLRSRWLRKSLRRGLQRRWRRECPRLHPLSQCL